MRIKAVSFKVHPEDINSRPGVLGRICKSLRGRVIAALFCSGGLALFGGSILKAGPCDPPPLGNPITYENSLPGNPASDWDILSNIDTQSQGFATPFSVNRGDPNPVYFKINTNSTSYRLDIYRMGYYNGLGARKVASINPSSLQTQPNCIDNTSTTGLIDCGNWLVSASWAVPSNATSGIYFAKIVRLDTTDGRSNHVFFIVRDDASHSDLLFQTSDPTWQAYNRYGINNTSIGNSLYVGSVPGIINGHATKVSYNRPFVMTQITATDTGPTFRDGQHGVFAAEYPMVRFLEKNGYDVSYFAGVDTDQRGSLILNHKVFLSVGHDEYWSGGQRTNVEYARSQGIHLAFFSGNSVYWKTRWEDNYRTLVCYKEPDATDPSSFWTGLWWYSLNSPPKDGGRPQNALIGTVYTDIALRSDALTVDPTFRSLRFWRNTAVASLATGQSVSFSSILGYEWDEAPQDSSTPAGLLRLSTTTVTLPSRTASHNLTFYRDASGALVFGAGTVQWSWGLELSGDCATCSPPPRSCNGCSTPDVNLQQATVNLFADMGAQPLTLQCNLVRAQASTDTIAPTVTIAAVPGTVTTGTPLTITGSAADTGGGVVASVELSFDGGNTWYKAIGTTSWSYTWTPSAAAVVTIKVRAIDDSGNIGVPVSQGPVAVVLRNCPCSLWENGAVTISGQATDTPIELGVKFTPDSVGTVRAIKFYKAPGIQAGSHTGNLWNSSGTLLGSIGFSSESASGWQQAAFALPGISVTTTASANPFYIASYNAQSGGYLGNQGQFYQAGVDNTPLHALQNGLYGSNGVYGRGPAGVTSVFPDQFTNSNNFWVDLVFQPQACRFGSLQPHMRALWSLDEASGPTAADSSTSGLNTGTATGTTIVDGRYGLARQFNGLSDTVVVGTGSGLAIGSGTISVGAWVNPTRPNNFILGYAGAYANYGLYSIFTSNYQPSYGFFGGGVHQMYQCNQALAPNQPSHVVFSYTMGQGNSIQCYINGQLVSGSWISGDGNSLPDPNGGGAPLSFEIGHWYGTPSGTDRYWFQGMIDEAFVSDQILSQSQIQGIYVNTCTDSTIACVPSAALSSVKGKWTLNETTGTTVSDSSGNGNTGTVTGTTVVNGVWANARRFNGSSDKIAIGIGTGLNISSGAISVGAWVNPERGNNFIFGYAGSYANYGLYSIFTSNGRPSYGYFGGGVHQMYQCNALLPTSRVSQVTFTYTMGQGSSITCYVNGRAVSGSWISGNGNSLPDPNGGGAPLSFEIGHWYGSPSGTDKYWFQGMIDEPFVIARILTPDDILAMYYNNQTCK